MKKTITSIAGLFLLAITTYGGYKTYSAYNSNEEDYLLLANVEALADDENGSDSDIDQKRKCFSDNGNWNMATVCTESGFLNVQCTVAGELTFLGVTIKGSFTKGKTEHIAWARYSCVDSKGNCCSKIGLFTGNTKLA